MDQQDWLLKIGQKIGGCVVLGYLGKGGMGQVFLAQQVGREEHVGLKRRVALKVAVPDPAREGSVQQFLKEAQLAAQIYHSNVVTIHDVGQEGDLYYIVMQHIHGKNLGELLKAASGPLPWRSALRITQLAAWGLDALHKHELVHRDVKPSNIMLSVDRGVYLMDFGLVREETNPLSTRSGSIEGTIPFMSPEQCRGEPLDRRSDIFSLGSTLYCLVTGRLPFLHDDPREVLDMIGSGSRPPEVGLFNAEVPPGVIALLSKAMAADPRGRFQSAAEMATKLGNILRGAIAPPTITLPGKQSAPEPAAPQPHLTPIGELLPLVTQRDVARSKLPIVGGALAGLGALALLVWLAVAGGRHDPPLPPPPPVNMIYIEPGYAQLGNDPAKLQKFFSSRPECATMSAEEIRAVLKGFTLEPQERVFVPGFHIDRYEVTNAEYAEFIAATGHSPPSLWHGTTPPIGRENYPVADVRYEDAEAYARWKGKKLPTREQWMRAFRGDSDRLFPWGDQYDNSRANVGDNKQFPYTSPVAQTPQDVTAMNVFNMMGNAAEYVRGVMHHEGKSWRVLKGGCYNRFGFRYGIGSSQLIQPLEGTAENAGFRCVVEEPSRGAAARQGAAPK